MEDLQQEDTDSESNHCILPNNITVPTSVQDFQLPREYFTLLAKDLYKNIKENVSHNPQLLCYEDGKQCLVKCNCTPEEGCGPSCQNRLLFM